MDAFARLQDLSALMHLEPAEDVAKVKLTSFRPSVHQTPSQPANSCKPDPYFVSQAQLPNGKQITLLKTLLTSACERNCNYCPFRAGRDFRRATLSPDEMAQAFMSMYRSGIVQGIFLSSGIVGGSLRTQDQLIATAEILRNKYAFRDYIHLKLMPGAEKDQVERSMQLADRVSVNLEAPNTQRLELLAPRKAFMEELIQPLRWVEQIRRTKPGYMGWNGHWPSMTTQFVVGAVGESDLELLATTEDMYRTLRLGRAYYMAFHPIPDTPFDNLPPESPIREHRLYQASFLLRDYGFDLEDLMFEDSGNLPMSVDPKTAYARNHLGESPLEINHASRPELLRIPGIGPKGADAILTARRRGVLRHLEDLQHIGVNPSKVAPYILLAGKLPDRQLSFW